MLALRLSLVAACCLAAAAASSVQSMPASSSPAEAAAVRAVLSRVLRLRPPPPPPAAAPAHPPPRHMLELYRKYAAGAARRPHHGNTVRSILPDPELSSLDSMLVFNVSVVAAAFSAGGEEVRAAQLLLQGGRCWPENHHHHEHHQHHHNHQNHHNHREQQAQPALPPLALAPPCRARLYRLHTAEPGGSRRRRRPLSLLSTLPLAPARAGWTSLEVTAPLRELLLLQGRALAVRFEAPGGRPMPPRAFMQPGADDRAAFLVVFSDDVDDENRVDDGEADGGGSGGRQAAKAGAEDFRPRHTHDMVELLHAAGADVFQSSARVANTSAGGGSSATVQTTAAPAWSRPTKHRLMLESNALEPGPQPQHWRHHGSRLLVKRSIEDNELPETGAVAEEGEAAVARLSPDLLLHARGHQGRDAPDASSDVIPLPGGGHGSGKRGRGGGGGGGGGKRRRGRGRKHGRRARKRPPHHQQQEAEWAENAAGSEAAGNSSATATCRRHRMAVNFADIGWADWIIAPEAFDAYFCAGRCPFPLPNSLGWTNHAFLQSLVRSLGQDEVPAPCCAPSALSDLTLLYNDNSVVVLRRFPKMSVLSCSCQ